MQYLAKQILEIVSEVTGVSVADIKSRSRKQEVDEARSMCYKALYSAGFSYPQIGKIMLRNHASAYSGAQRINGLLDVKDEKVCREWEEIVERVGSK